MESRIKCSNGGIKAYHIRALIPQVELHMVATGINTNRWWITYLRLVTCPGICCDGEDDDGARIPETSKVIASGLVFLELPTFSSPSIVNRSSCVLVVACVVVLCECERCRESCWILVRLRGLRVVDPRQVERVASCWISVRLRELWYNDWWLKKMIGWMIEMIGRSLYRVGVCNRFG